MSEEESEAHIVGVIFAHKFSLNKGLKLSGDKANVSVQKELSQIHAMDTYEPIMKSLLKIEDRRNSLASLMFITEERNGDIKARKVVDGSKQRMYDRYNKSDGLLPTVSTDSIFLTGVVDAREKRTKAILDIANVFLHTENNEKILILLCGKLSKMMVQVYPIIYRNYVTYLPNGQAMLYFRFSKSLYGMLRADILFYKRLRSDLENMGLKINLHDPCVANNMVNGHQMTTCWHVDDPKVSHKDESSVTVLVENLVEIYGPKTTVSRGKVHEYLGMNIN